jgi:hypothetical protein
MRCEGQHYVAMPSENQASAPRMRPEEGVDIVAELRRDETARWCARRSS